MLFEEARVALFEMNPKKAPGLNVYTAAFFQGQWDLVGVEVWWAI